MSDTRTVMNIDVRSLTSSVFRRFALLPDTSSSWYCGGAPSAPYAGGCRGLGGSQSDGFLSVVESLPADTGDGGLRSKTTSLVEMLTLGADGYRTGGP